MCLGRQQDYTCTCSSHAHHHASINLILGTVTICGADGNPYCKYNSQPLQWFTSSLFIAGVFAALPAGYTTRCPFYISYLLPAEMMVVANGTVPAKLSPSFSSTGAMGVCKNNHALRMLDFCLLDYAPDFRASTLLHMCNILLSVKVALAGGAGIKTEQLTHV
jgi:hypothetical protein